MIRVVVFDWDGTLMDSEARIVMAMQQAFLASGALRPSRPAIREIIGLDLGVAVARLGPQLGASQIQAVVADYRQHYARLHAVPSPLFDGALAVLAQLTEAGYTLAVATGKSRRGLDRAMDESGVAAYFATTRCGEEAASKPDPAMLHDIMLDLDAAPAEAIMIGDTEFDLLMAAAAGVRAGAATYGAHDRQRLLALKPALIVDAIEALPAAIAQLNRSSQPV